MNRKLFDDALRITRDAIESVLPGRAVRRAISDMSFPGRIYLLAEGKAAWSMASAACDTLGNRIDRGIVITKYGHIGGKLDKCACFEAGHPVPDDNSFAATQKAIDMVTGLRAEDTVLFLVSGGASALFEKPLISGEELARVTEALLKGGADIREINTVRKRLSAVKGGQFAHLCYPARIQEIVLSDVIGDAPDVIASGPAHPDASTPAEAMSIGDKYRLPLSEEGRRLLARELPQDIGNVTSHVTGSVRELCRGAAESCAILGYRPVILTDRLTCQAREAGAFLGSIAAANASDGGRAFIAGGETVVRVRGGGLGGRNQEVALGAAERIRGINNVCVFSVGSDGTDGPTDAAGGYADGDTAASLEAEGLTADGVLDDNDAYHALKRISSLIVTGPTGTNVNDVSVVLIK